MPEQPYRTTRNASRATVAAQSTPVSGRGLLVLIVVLGVVIVLELAFHFAVAPNLRLTRIELAQDGYWTREAILEASGIPNPAYYFSVDVEAVARNLEGLAGIKRAVVEKVFPDTLKLTLQARQAVAVAVVSGQDGATKVMGMDAEGVLFPLPAEAVRAGGLPMVSGLDERVLAGGGRLPAIMTDFLTSLDEVRTSSRQYYDFFSEFRLEQDGDGLYSLLAFPVGVPIPVRMQPELSAKSCETAVLVLDVMKKEHIIERLRELDVRTSQVTYRVRGE